ncbi:MAG: 4Fe-4S dicluster domain-containing protein [Chloroflexi bacterium]|nr:4Fe-4S dicluster domain-containing protein [Chloroflexota bacterium]
MNLSRRQFLKGGAATLGGVALLSSPMAYALRNSTKTEAPPETKLEQYDWEKHYYAFAVDTTKCIGCGKCVVACKLENKVPPDPEHTRTWVERYVITEEQEIFVDSPEAGMEGFVQPQMNLKYQGLAISESFFVPKLCNQCEKPPCVQVCPVAATYATKDGVILVDQKRCIGCRYCIQACPYGARYLVPDGDVTPNGYSRVADKCTWCYHRVVKGHPPACVEACPVGARVFGDMRDPQSPVREILRHSRVYTLKPSLGTKPKVFYIGLHFGVV